MMITENEKKTLDKVFYGENLSTRGLQTFSKELKRQGISISNDKIKFYYDNQEVVQLFKKVDNKVKLPKINIGEPFSKIYIDSMYLTSANITLINVIDFFTKFGLIKAYRGNSTSSEKAMKAIEEYNGLVEDLGYTIDTVYSDNGSEFMGKFEKYLEKEGIPHILTNVGDKRQTSPIETFNKTVRSLFEKYIAVNGFDITKVFEVIKKLNKLYNNSYHSTLGFSPLEVVKDTKKQNEYISRWKKSRSETVEKFKIGDFVRVPIEKDVFSKLSANFSKKLYKIVGYENNRYSLEGLKQTYPPNLLQFVDTKNLMIYKTVKERVKRKKNREVEILKDFLGEGDYYKEKRNLRNK